VMERIGSEPYICHVNKGDVSGPISRKPIQRENKIKLGQHVKQQLENKEVPGVYSSLNDLIDERLREDLQFSEDDITSTAAIGPSYIHQSKIMDSNLANSLLQDSDNKRPSTALINLEQQDKSGELEAGLLCPWKRERPTGATKGLDSKRAKQCNGRQLCMPASSPVNKPALPVLSGKSATVLPFVPADYSHRKAVNRKVLRDAINNKTVETGRLSTVYQKSPIMIADNRENSAEVGRAWVQDVHGTYKTCSSKAKQNVFASPNLVSTTRSRWVLFKENQFRTSSQAFKNHFGSGRDVNEVANFIRSFFDASNRRINDETLAKSQMKLAASHLNLSNSNRSRFQGSNYDRKLKVKPSPAINLLSRRIWLQKSQHTSGLLNSSNGHSDNQIRYKALGSVSLELPNSTRPRSKLRIEPNSAVLAAMRWKANSSPGSPDMQRSGVMDSGGRGKGQQWEGVHRIGLQPLARYT
jgi:hypothetical protein